MCRIHPDDVTAAILCHYAHHTLRQLETGDNDGPGITRSCVKGHFPKLVDCAHFHYENVDFGAIQVRTSYSFTHTVYSLQMC
uniref:Uncharacterized protein n=1 Tax=Erpetoichthys calabaricus TaxID=27687 RepID=A0A8C4XE91_ERPCA